eukprot:364829-Chlamydomonas_euryale.AAC.7
MEIATYKDAPWLGCGFREARARLLAYHKGRRKGINQVDCVIASGVRSADALRIGTMETCVAVCPRPTAVSFAFVAPNVVVAPPPAVSTVSGRVAVQWCLSTCTSSVHLCLSQARAPPKQGPLPSMQLSSCPLSAYYNSAPIPPPFGCSSGYVALLSCGVGVHFLHDRMGACLLGTMCMPPGCHVHASCVLCACLLGDMCMPPACYVDASCVLCACLLGDMCMPPGC